jgi:peptidoglycan biosynthesis protein MviN/MurJ (putative lipid II flippase)
MTIKIGMHNSCAAVAASLGGAPAAAHTLLFSVAMLCFTFGDVGSSLSQAFLPAFFKSNKRNISNESMVAVRQTLTQLLKCTLLISTVVVVLASLVLTAGKWQLSSDTAVHQQIQAVLPFLITTLCFHGTAVTLEGLLLAQQNFLGLSCTYSAVAFTMAACLYSVRYFEAGLTGIWSCYIWFQASRIMAFSVLGGLVNPKQWFKWKKSTVIELSI